MTEYTKTCSKCKEEKQTSDFYKNKTKSGGLESYCKDCKKQYQTMYQKIYYQNNKEKIKTRAKENYKSSRDKRLQYSKQYAKENRAKIALASSKKRARRFYNTPEPLRGCPKEADRLVKIYNLRYLLTVITGIEHHVDHIWPLSKGGPHWSGNLQIITAEKNMRKSDSFCEDTARVIQESLDLFLASRRDDDSI